jgi:hypothetical protein
MRGAWLQIVDCPLLFRAFNGGRTEISVEERNECSTLEAISDVLEEGPPRNAGNVRMKFVVSHALS